MMDSLYLHYRNNCYWMIPLLIFVFAIMVVGVTHETPFDEDFCYVWTVIIVLQAMYLASSLRLGTAQWMEAERLRKSGVPVEVICTDWQWIAYYRFSEFTQAEWIRGDLGKAQGRFWAEWLPEQEKQARYHIKAASSDNFLQPHGWEIINKIDVLSLKFNQVSFSPLSYNPVSVYTLQKLTE